LSKKAVILQNGKEYISSLKTINSEELYGSSNIALLTDSDIKTIETVDLVGTGDISVATINSNDIFNSTENFTLADAVHTHVASDVTDFDVEVSNNTDVAANSTHRAITTGNPHNVTKSDVGLSDVDNTSDVDKPISTATQTALDNKQDTLISGTNIKTINGDSVLGSGDLTVGGLPSGSALEMLWHDGSDWTDTNYLTYDDLIGTLKVDDGIIKPNHSVNINHTYGLTCFTNALSDDNIANLNFERLRIELGTDYSELHKHGLKLSSAIDSESSRSIYKDDGFCVGWIDGQYIVESNVNLPENIIPATANLNFNIPENSDYKVKITGELYIQFESGALSDTIKLQLVTGTIGNSTVTPYTYGKYERFYAPLTGIQSRNTDSYLVTHNWNNILIDNVTRSTDDVYLHEFSIITRISTGTGLDNLGLKLWKEGSISNATLLQGSNMNVEIMNI